MSHQPTCSTCLGSSAKSKLYTTECDHTFCFNCMDMYVCVNRNTDCSRCGKEVGNKFIQEIQEQKQIELNLLRAALLLKPRKNFPHK